MGNEEFKTIQELEAERRKIIKHYTERNYPTIIDKGILSHTFWYYINSNLKFGQLSPLHIDYALDEVLAKAKIQARKDVLGLIDEGCGQYDSKNPKLTRCCGDILFNNTIWLCPRCEELKKRI